MHWYLLQNGYGSIPMKIPFLVGYEHPFTIIYQLFWCEQKGYYWFWHTAIWATIFYYILTMLWHSNVSDHNFWDKKCFHQPRFHKSQAPQISCHRHSMFHFYVHLPSSSNENLSQGSSESSSWQVITWSTQIFFSLLAQSGYWFWFLGNPSEQNSPFNILWDPMSGKFSHPLVGKNIFRIPSGKRLLAMENHYF